MPRESAIFVGAAKVLERGVASQHLAGEFFILDQVTTVETLS